jgi:CPA2 family monovalent cation:H+ antiporter-2
MGHLPLIDELAVIAALGVLVTVLLAKLRLPTVAGLLLAGALAGPHSLHLVRSIQSIEVLAEIGVVLLLFSIGLEFSLARLRHIFRSVALGGLMQVGLTVLTTWVIAVIAGVPAGRALLIGFIFAMSSTAIVLRALGDRRELDAPHGRFIVGTLIFQDLLVVPMVLVVPLLAPSAGDAAHAMGQIAFALGKAVVVVLGIGVAARALVPRLLGWVDASRSREVFLLAVLGLCIGTAWLTSLAGLSLALGAFLGGMVVADTEYGHRAMGDILPLRDAFVSVFFVSLGMLFDLRVAVTHPLLVGGLLLGFLLGKGFLATIAAQFMRFPARVAWLAGVGLAQFGEFGFVLARLGRDAGVIDAEAIKPILTAGIASMFLTPVLVRIAPHVTAGERLLAPLEKLIGVSAIDEIDEGGDLLSHHVIVVGYGVAGRLAAQALAQSGVPYIVLELNAESVRRGRDAGVPIYYGDATSPEALRHAHLAHARALVLLMNDPQAAMRVTDTARRVAPGVPVVMRTRYLLERQALEQLGAAEVVAEEVEGGVEIIARLLRRLEVPRNVINRCIRAARDESTQPSARKETLPRMSIASLTALAEMKVESVLVERESPANQKSAIVLDVRRATGALVIGVRRDGALIENADPAEPFREGDVIYLAGTGEGIRAAIDLLAGPVARASEVVVIPEPDERTG